jgi:hypothetical protein
MTRIVKTVTATKTTSVARDAVKAGTVFVNLTKDGKRMTERYAALGHNGKFFSINLANGALASSSNGRKKVAEVGAFNFRVTLLPEAQQVRKARKDVTDSEAFKVVGRDLDERKTYINLGKLADGRFTSLDLNKPFGEDYATTDEGNKQVVVVGTYEIDAKIAA